MQILCALENVKYFRFTYIKHVRMDGFKLEGGEWFKEGFQKLLSQE